MKLCKDLETVLINASSLQGGGELHPGGHVQLHQQVRGRGERVREERDGPGVGVLGEQGTAAVLGGESTQPNVVTGYLTLRNKPGPGQTFTFDLGGTKETKVKNIR